jgi:signal transduction histidine kinase
VALRPRLMVIAAALLGNSIAVALVLGSEHETDLRTIVIVTVVSWSFVVSGLIASARRSVRFGALMCATGLSLNLEALVDSENSLVFTVGSIIGDAWIAVFIHALLAFPSGRLPSRAAVGTAVAAYAVLTIGQLVVYLFDDLADECPECPDNAVLITADDTIAAALDAIVSAIGALVAVAVIVELAGRWRAASPPLRRALAPVVGTGGAAIVLLAALYASYTIAPGVYDVLAWLLLAVIAAFPFAFLVGLLRMRLARLAVGRLVVDLGSTPADSELRDALRRALHDPELTIAYWQPDLGDFVDGGGGPVPLPQPGDERTASVIERDGRPVAALIHDAVLELDPELIEAVAAAAGLALENERLQAELRARLEDLRASRTRIVEAQASERRRLERNLHDGAQQRLVALALELRTAERREIADPAANREILSAAGRHLQQAIDELRELARGIHPAVLSDRGLGAALDALAARTPLVVTVDVEDQQLPEAIEVAAYYVAAEALTNVVKHAQATEATLRMERLADRAVLEVADDGVGGADLQGGSGLRGLADRVEALDGRLEISSLPGRGTRIRAAFPLPDPARARGVEARPLS